MAKEFSFDVVSNLDLQEVDNAVNVANKEMLVRYDFKGSKSKISFDREGSIEVISDDEARLKVVIDILQGKLAKRRVSLKALTYGKVEDAAEGTAKLTISLVQGIEQEKAKQINKFLKDRKVKANTQIQGDQLRVSSKSKDSLQEAMNLIKGSDFGIPLQFVNLR